jgi:hypothetical protein
LHLAFELSWNQRKLAFTIGHGQAPRLRTVAARDLPALLKEIARAKRRFGLPDAAAVVSCYEAGRDGFWLHRWLTSQSITNVIVDSASIEVNRRKRRAKSDRLDAAKLVSMLLRYHGGETKVWSVVRVPGADDEDRRQLHRELIAARLDSRRAEAKGALADPPNVFGAAGRIRTPGVVPLTWLATATTEPRGVAAQELRSSLDATSASQVGNSGVRDLTLVFIDVCSALPSTDPWTV